MSFSPAQRHSQRVQMQQQLARFESVNSVHRLHVQKRALDEDIKQLRQLPSIAERIAMKRDTLLPKWLPTVNAYLASGKIYVNPIFAWCVIWLFDVERLDEALDRADIAIKQHQPTPENIKSRFPAFVADTMLEWSMRECESGESIEPYFSRTFNNVVYQWRLHEEIVAKWLKFAGLRLLRDDEGKTRASAMDDPERLEKADTLLAEAHAKYKKIGVKTLRESIHARLRALNAINAVAQG